MEKLSLTGKVKTLNLIGKYKFSPGLEIALRGFLDDYKATQNSGAGALDQIFAPQIVGKLLHVMDRYSDENSKNLARKLIQSHYEEAVPELIKALDTDDQSMQQTIFNELGLFDANKQLITIKELEKILFDQNSSSRLREMALHVLRSIPTDNARDLINRWKQTQTKNHGGL